MLTEFTKSRIKSIETGARTQLYHLQQARKAKQMLRHIEAERGATSTRIKNESREYAEHVLGWHGYAPWLVIYAALRGRFHEGWIPVNYYQRVVAPALKGNYGELSELRCVNSHLFASESIPDLAYAINGALYDRTYQPINAQQAVELFRDRKVIFKKDASGKGMGLMEWRHAEMKPEQISSLGDGVFQYFVQQHSFFDEIMPNSACTLRLTTTTEADGGIRLRSGYLRAGRKSDSHVQSATQVRVAVDSSDGKLDAIGYHPNWHTTTSHPDSGFEFADQTIPYFERCVALVQKLHARIPYVRCIGWDLVLDRDNTPMVLEWNGGYNAVSFSEAIQGPCFADLGWERLWQRKQAS